MIFPAPNSRAAQAFKIPIGPAPIQFAQKAAATDEVVAAGDLQRLGDVVHAGRQVRDRPLTVRACGIDAALQRFRVIGAAVSPRAKIALGVEDSAGDGNRRAKETLVG